IRSLRSRMFMDATTRGAVRGVLVRMGNSTRTLDLKSGRTRTPLEYDALSSEEDVALTASYPTDLVALTATAFDRIARHGYEVADHTLTAYATNAFAES